MSQDKPYKPSSPAPSPSPSPQPSRDRGDAYDNVRKYIEVDRTTAPPPPPSPTPRE